MTAKFSRVTVHACKAMLSSAIGSLAFTAIIAGLHPHTAHSQTEVVSDIAPSRVHSVTTETQSAQNALIWLRPLQAADGSYGGTGSTLDVIFAVAAANQDPSTWITGTGKSLIDALRTTTATAYAGSGAAQAGKLALGIAAADLDPRAFGGLDLVISMTAHYNAATGAFGASNWDQAFSMLGWQAAGEAIPITATQLLVSRQITDGGWEFSTGFGPDSNSTALMIQALAAGGQSITSTTVLSGLDYLRLTQNSDGGFGYDPNSPSDVNSTAFAIQGLIAAGQDPLSTTWMVSGNTAIGFLLSQQQPDGGFVYLAPPSNALATRQAVPALLGKPFPLLSKSVALRKALSYIATTQTANGGFGSAGTTIDAMQAILAAGSDPQSFVTNSVRPLDYLATQALTYTSGSAAAIGKLIVGVVTAGGDPRNFAGLDLVVSATARYSATTGQFGTSVWDQSWVLMGLKAAGQSIPPAAVARLHTSTATGGGWGFSVGANSADPDSTGLALQAAAASGIPSTDPAIAGALAFLRASQVFDGGFGYGTTNANSSGYAAQGLCAYKQSIRLTLDWATSSTNSAVGRLALRTPTEALLGLQLPSGGFASPFSVPLATYQAVPGVACRAFPLRERTVLLLPFAAKQP
jgi:prenyltransferase beta subunit